MEVTDVKDMTGWPIVIGARARIVYTMSSGRKFYRHGEVTKVHVKEHGTVVEVRLYKNLSLIVASPSQIQIMKGKTKNSFEYEILKEKIRRRK